MRFLAIHDAHGDIRRIVALPSGAPAGGIAPAPGLFATEVETTEVSIDPADPSSYERLLHLIKDFRIEVATGARLVRKEPPRQR